MAALVDIPIGHPPLPPQVDFTHRPLLPQPSSTLAPATKFPEVLTNGAVKQQAATATASTNGVTEDPFKLDTKFAYTPRKMRVITIGAGFSGLLMAHKFQHRFPEMREIVEHKIFDMRDDVGGTWLANHYPGVQCDVPAHIYVSRYDSVVISRFISISPLAFQTC
jgi:NAD(P)-binding Rossmann-like domain